MANNYFRFKQFTVYQQNAAMKVGTDGVLLGAWTQTGEATRILDVGTGTGLIALMLAQRTSAVIDALEIDEAAYRQAAENVQKSPWPQQINVIHGSFQDFSVATSQRYDLIVSNPPYFINSLKPGDEMRSRARHDEGLPQTDLLDGVLRCLTPEGRLSVVLPYIEGNVFIAEAAARGLYCNRKLNVRPDASRKIIRLLLEFSPVKKELEEADLAIDTGERNYYTPEYKALTKDYYLNF